LTSRSKNRQIEPTRDRNPDYAKILGPLLEEAAANAEGDFVSAVKSVMRARIGAGALTRDSVRSTMGLNPRTLAHLRKRKA
jgi:hypothetical protein